MLLAGQAAASGERCAAASRPQRAHGAARTRSGRSRPAGRIAAAVIALWKDSALGTREIPPEPGAQGVLLSASADRATRRSYDGRRPVDNDIEFFSLSVYQVQAAGAGSDLGGSGLDPPSVHVLEGEDLTILTSWAEAFAEGLTSQPGRLPAALADAQAAAPWRAELGLPEPSPQLDEAIRCLIQDAQVAAADHSEPLDALLPIVSCTPSGNTALGRLARRVLRSALEQRQTLQRQQSR